MPAVWKEIGEESWHRYLALFQVWLYIRRWDIYTANADGYSSTEGDKEGSGGWRRDRDDGR